MNLQLFHWMDDLGILLLNQQMYVGVDYYTALLRRIGGQGGLGETSSNNVAIIRRCKYFTFKLHEPISTFVPVSFYKIIMYCLNDRRFW